MSAKVLQQVTAVLYRLVNVKTGHGASRSSDKLRRFSEHHCWTIILLCQARGHDTDHPLMPVRVIYHYRPVVVNVLHIVDDRIRLVGDFLVQFSPLLVVLIDALALFPRHRAIFRQQQLYCLLTVHHASRGVDARPYLKDDITDRDLLARQSANVDNPFES